MNRYNDLLAAFRAHELGQLPSPPTLTTDRLTDAEQDGVRTFLFPTVMTSDWNDNDWRVDLNALDLTDYHANPVVCLSHMTHLPPVGKAETWFNQLTRHLSARITFADTPTGNELADLYATKTMRGISPGILPTHFKFTDQGIDVSAAKLKELSVVSIPAYPDALAAALGLQAPHHDQPTKASFSQAISETFWRQQWKR